MKFEEIIRKLSAILASFFIFFISAGVYLSIKGFKMDANGNLTLVTPVEAAIAKKEPLKTAATKTTSATTTDTGTNTVNINYPKNYILGNPEAPVTIYEYSSLGCFHCADFHNGILPKLNAEYIKSGEVNLIFADFPLDKASMQASMIARCIPEDKYYDFLSLIFKKQREWSFLNGEKVLIKYATLNGLSKEKAVQCLKDDDTAKEITDIRHEAIEKINIEGTPTLLIVSKDRREILHGIRNYPELTNILETKFGIKLINK